MGEIILCIGAATFPRVLFQALRKIAPIQQLAIFRSDADGRFEVLAEETQAGAPSAFPARPYVAADGEGGDSTGADPRQVRLQFFDAAGAGVAAASCRAVLSVRRPDDTLIVDLLGPSRMEGFSADVQRRLLVYSGSVACAVERHFDLMRPAVASSLSAWSRRMQRLPGLPSLSTQEAVVCAHILEGHSNKTIALDEGISVHSVVTYRRRAYSKLNITSLNELFSLMLRARGGDPDGRGPSEAPRRLGFAESFVP